MRWLMEPIRNGSSIGKDLTGGGSRRTKAQGQRPRRISNLCAPRWKQLFGGASAKLAAQILFAFHNDGRDIKNSDGIDFIHAVYLPHADLWRGDRAFSNKLPRQLVGGVAIARCRCGRRLSPRLFKRKPSSTSVSPRRARSSPLSVSLGYARAASRSPSAPPNCGARTSPAARNVNSAIPVPRGSTMTIRSRRLRVSRPSPTTPVSAIAAPITRSVSTAIGPSG
jgi:hypothetical protein